MFNKNRKRINELQHRLSVLEGGAGVVSEHRARIEKLEQIAPAIGGLEQRVSAISTLEQRLSALESGGSAISENALLIANLEQRIANLKQRLSSLESNLVSASSSSAPALPATAEEQVQKFETRKSYSIEAEDLLLETVFLVVLKRYGPGTYVDIGAAHPVQHSNTYFFYERGWSGLCVEPNPEFYELYKVLRPRDHALNIGVAKRSGSLRYHRFEHPLINGFFGQDLVDRHVASGQTYLGSSDVPCLSVDEFLNTKIDGPVDLLNIDVETMDAALLAAWNWEACRPKVICAEIHTPSIESMLETDVAKILKAAGYTAMCRGWLSAIFVDGKLGTTEPWNT